ncbi:pH-response regulator protein palA/rim20 [Nowakowskiella sp. JEL0407]|nr:pH-response regulator protein palA/rim20 [Nowakowskiella sp. JEL0407]
MSFATASFLFSVPSKKSPECSLVPALRSYIKSSYREDPDVYLDDFRLLQELRAEVASTNASLSKILEYYAQLVFLMSKFRIEEGQIPVKFEWSSAFGDKKNVSSLNATYELSNVLFVLGSTYCSQAIQESVLLDGLKASAANFQKAAGAFDHILNTKDSFRFPLPPIKDFEKGMLEVLKFTNLAQAQECFWLKAVQEGKMKPATLAKLASSVSSLYSQALASSQSLPPSTFPANYQNNLNAKSLQFRAETCFRKSCELEIMAEKGVASSLGVRGEEIRWLLECKQEITKVLGLRSADKSVVEFVKNLSKIVEDKLQGKMKDNDLIYLETVPASVKPVDPTTVVSATPLPSISELKQLIKTPLFQNLVPFAVYQSLSVYTDKRDNFVKDQISKLNDATGAANTALSKMNLPGALDAITQPVGLPPQLLKRSEEVRKLGGVKSLYDSMKTIEELSTQNLNILEEALQFLDNEANDDKAMRAQFGARWTRTPSESLTKNLRDTAKLYREKLDAAKKSDLIVKEKVDKVQGFVEAICCDKDELEASIPASSKRVNTSDPVVTGLRALLDTFSTNVKKRGILIDEMKKFAFSDDIGHVLSEEYSRNSEINEEEVFAKELEKYRKFTKIIEELIGEQQNLFMAIEEANSQFTGSVNKNEELKLRERALQNLDIGYKSFKEISSNLSEGVKFYTDFQVILQRFRSNCEDFAFARNVDKKDQLTALQNSVAGISPANQPGTGFYPSSMPPAGSWNPSIPLQYSDPSRQQQPNFPGQYGPPRGNQGQSPYNPNFPYNPSYQQAVLMILTAEKEIEINALIREYLAFADYKKSIQVFDDEAYGKGRRGQDQFKTDHHKETNNTLDGILNHFILAFREGDRSGFFELWDTHFPMTTRMNDPLFQKLEFILSIYFAVFPIHSHVSETFASRIKLSSSMDQFKTFLETRGAQLSKTTQFLSFYALPYVPDPRTHLSFQEIFTKQWVDETEERLKKFILSAFQYEETPRLLKFVHNLDMRSSNESKQDRAEIVECRTNIRSLEARERESNVKLRSLQNNYHNLITIASELVQALAASVNGEKITPKYLSNIIQRLGAFKKRNQEPSEVLKQETNVPVALHEQEQPRLQAHSADNITQSQLPPEFPTRKTQSSISSQRPSNSTKPINPIRRTDVVEPEATSNKIEKDTFSNEIEDRHDSISSIRNMSVDKGILRNDGVIDGFSIEDFDFEIILNDLVPQTQSFQNQQQLLKSIRLLLNQNKNLPNCDILGLKINLPQQILTQSNDAVKLQFMKLVNAVTSSPSGRDQIVNSRENDSFVSLLVDELNKTPVECAYRQNILGALQKLSLRRRMQTVLNKKNMVTYLFNLLYENVDELSEYTIEYSSSLLMNLCLRTLGKKQCKDQDYDLIFKVLNSLLEVDNFQVKTYAHGIFYSLLNDSEIRKAAIEFGMDEILTFLKKQYTDEGLAGQIEFVIQQLHSDDDSDVSDIESDDGRDDEDVLEQEDIQLDFPDEISELSSNEKQAQFGKAELNLLKKYLKHSSLNSEEPAQVKNSKITIARQQKSSLSLSFAKKHLNEPYTRPINPLAPIKLRSLSSTPDVVQQSFFNTRKQTPVSADPIKIETNPNPVLNQIPTRPKKQKNNSEIYSAEEFQVAFTTREKVPRTPIPQK